MKKSAIARNDARVEAIAAAERALYEANARDPYVHADYQRAEDALRACIRSVVGPRNTTAVISQALNNGDAVFTLIELGYVTKEER